MPSRLGLVQRWLDAVRSGDGQAVAALYTPDGVHEDVPSGTAAQGPRAIAAFIDGMAGQLADVTATPTAVHPTADGVVLEYTSSATDVASGKRTTSRGVTIFELQGDRIRRSADYYDVAGILAQLGLLPPIMDEGTPAATPAS